MKAKRIISCLALCSPLLLALSPLSWAQAPSNVILIIGDGMDDQQITAARNYLHGAQGHTILDTMPVRSAVQVLTVSNEDPSQVIYVADSANSATAMATGQVTSIGRISTTAQSDHDLTTIVEMAQTKGLKTGIVTTASITDATPSAFVAHVNMRGCEGPKQMVNYESYGDFVIDCHKDTQQSGGLGSISEQLANSNVDVLLGGGKKFFKQAPENNATKNIFKQAQKNGFAVVNDFEKATAASADQKLLGLFAKKHLPVRWQGTDGRIAEKPQYSFLHFFHEYIGTVTLPDTMKCEANPEFAKQNTPNLKDMASLAINRLDNPKGFFLMIESASIDKQSHKRNPCGHIGEAQQLFETVQVALDYAKKQGNTLVMITADHGQAAQIIPDGSLFSAYGAPIATPGLVARVETPEGGILAMNYATNEFSHEEHTGVNVPFFANKQVVAESGEQVIKPMLKQTDIFEVSRVYLGL
jgi:alkaline phosphatase